MSFQLPPTRTAAVLDQLRAEIVAGILPPGHVIKDAELAARLSVSITPVREAIAQLGREGLIEISPNRWRRVAEMTLDQAIATLDLQFILYGGALERAVPEFTDDDLTQLEENLARLRDAVAAGHAASAVDAVAGFYDLAITRAGNAELSGVWNLVYGRGRRYMGLSSTSELWHTWITGFTEIHEAIRERDPDLAMRRVRDMARRVREDTLAADAGSYVLGAPSTDPRP